MRALVAPRRAVPIALVCVPLVLAQVRFSRSGQAVWAALLMCALFVLLGPFAWRALVTRARGGRAALALLLYGAIGGLPALFGWALPEVLGLGETFLTAGINLAVSTSLFWVGGWGLARDIDLELGLQRERARAEALAREAERTQLLAMRAHLDPHFLFNTLNAIAEVCREDGVLAERSILALSALLRQVLRGARAAVWPLSAELGVVRDLWALHHLRDPGRFDVRWSVAVGCDDVPVPPLILLPLAENAVKHGPGAGYRGVLALEATLAGGRLLLRMRNPGACGPARASGEGLDTVRRRLRLAYGADIAFGLFPVDDQGRPATEARLDLPATGPVEDRPT